MDANALLYLRARYYSPALGVFTGLDPVEGDAQQAMSLNRYGYVAGNVVNITDPSGLYGCDAEEATWSGLPSACLQLDTAFQRAQNAGVSDVSSTVENGMVNFGQLKSYIQNNFGFAIVGYSPTIPEGITDCTVTQTLVGVTGAPAKLSLVRTTSALLHIAAYFRYIGISLDKLRSNLGVGSTIQLVSDVVEFPNGTTIGAFTGNVPIEALGMNVYLGSDIGMYAIVHELGHLFDKRYDTRPSSALMGLRVRATNGLPRYTLPLGDFDASDFVASNLGLGGRASQDLDSREVWPDMFMTAVLDGQNVRSEGEIVGLIAWTPTPDPANRWLEEFKRAYTVIAIRRLMLGGNFPNISDTEAQKIAALSEITGLINPGIWSPRE
jgi:RHS repeat-associated protein